MMAHDRQHAKDNLEDVVQGCQLKGLAYLLLHCLKLDKELCGFLQPLVSAFCFLAQLESHLRMHIAHPSLPVNDCTLVQKSAIMMTTLVLSATAVQVQGSGAFKPTKPHPLGT